MKCFVNVILVLFIGFSDFYWVLGCLLSGVSGLAAGGGLTLTLNSGRSPLSAVCHEFA